MAQCISVDIYVMLLVRLNRMPRFDPVDICSRSCLGLPLIKMIYFPGCSTCINMDMIAHFDSVNIHSGSVCISAPSRCAAVG